MSLKRYVIELSVLETKLLLSANKRPFADYRIVPVSMTFSDR